jgi:large subunit ribosomal protein L7/L12
MATAKKATKDNVEKAMEIIESLTLIEMAELVKNLEEKFGVTAAAPIAAVAVPGAVPGAAAEAEEKTEFDAILSSIGSEKIKVIKVVRAITSLGLKEAKDLVEGAPKPIKEAVTKEEAESIKKQIEEVGGKVEIK